ncbi:MAG: sigma-70 family RNA polymerase sigma factor [Lachnospiraceae bacterium]|nr:sigma-70 family RNA polymerase sigma factor [Lachnospiraceae bacterium]
MTNEELVHLARDGDREARDKLIENILPSIRMTAGRIRKRYTGVFVEKDDLIQEALLGSLKAVDSYDPETGNLFWTYASKISENAMMDYVRKCIAAIPETGKMISLDETPPGFDPESGVTYADIILDEYSKTPEQLYIRKEAILEVRDALQKVRSREREYLHYRYGLIDDIQHDRTETAEHFHLSESRAKNTESKALKDVRKIFLEKRKLCRKLKMKNRKESRLCKRPA